MTPNAVVTSDVVSGFGWKDNGGDCRIYRAVISLAVACGLFATVVAQLLVLYHSVWN
jgi:hypothetical protein